MDTRGTDNWVGRPAARIDGPLKVTGRAVYAAEYYEPSGTAHGYILGAAIGHGRIAAIDSLAAEALPGVIAVLTHRNMPALPRYGTGAGENRYDGARPFLSSDEVRYFGEPVALVVAETLDIARHAAGLIRVDYVPDGNARYDLVADLDRAETPAKANAGHAAESRLGDFDAAFPAAPVRVDVVYRNGYQNHNPMEPHATLGVWDGRRLTLYTSCQILENYQDALAHTLGMQQADIRIVSRFIGGGFGSKLGAQADVVLAALAARRLQRPVRVVQTRQQMFANVGHRPAFVQHLRLGATADGRLVALGHDVVLQCARFDTFVEQAAAYNRSLYAAPNRRTSHRIVRLDMQYGDSMRAPGEAPGMLAGECAMDELAIALDMDPVELRLRNDTMEDPEKHVPFSSRHLAACLQEGARRFGWENRPRQPGSRREGRVLIGYGMASAIRSNYLRPARARVEIDSRGVVTARMDMTDIGTGSYTILAQIAADGLGVPITQVLVELGDSTLPRTPGSGGSFGAASAGSALYEACAALRGKIVAAAVADRRSPLYGANAGEAVFGEGMVQIGGRSERLTELAARIGGSGLAAEGEIKPGETYKTYSQQAFGAHFAEVGVDMDTCEIRLRRMLGVFAAGRILNLQTARSQLIGGMIWGASAALLEEGVVDPRYGLFVNHDLAEYHIPVNADVPQVEAVMLEEHDGKTNPLGSKGIGELGICGAGAAVANAVYNATGVRVRDFPITLDKVMAGLPMMTI